MGFLMLMRTFIGKNASKL